MAEVGLLVVVREDEGWKGQQGGADLQCRTLARRETVDVALAVCVLRRGGADDGGLEGVQSGLQL